MMTAEQLKASILQMAMQGKLVEQRPEEGTGKDLYKEIIEERKILVKEGRIKNDKEQSEKNEEPPFDIPESWQWAKLNDIVAKTIKRGKSPKYVQKSNTLVFAQKCNTKAGFIDLSLCLFLDEKQLSKYPDDEFMINDDIVINSTGHGTLGRVGIYRDPDNPNKLPLVPDSHVTVIRCSSLMDVGYVFNCLKYYQPYMEKLGSGSTNQTELGAGVLKELSFPIPPLAEQKRIVAKIEELMPFVDQYAAASTKLNTINASFPEMMKKSILQEAIQGKLVPQDPNDEPASVLIEKIAEEKNRLIKEKKIKKQKPLPEITEDEIPFDIPESWKWVRLSEICNVSDGTHQTPKYVDVGMPFISAQNIKPYRFMPEVHRFVSYEDYLEYNKNVSPEKGDILMTRVGAGIGEAAIIDKDLEFSIYVSLTLIKGYSEELNMKYILNVLNSPLGMALAKKKTLGKGASQGNLNLIFIREFLLPLPPKEEQKRINDKIEMFLPLCVNLNR